MLKSGGAFVLIDDRRCASSCLWKYCDFIAYVEQTNKEAEGEMKGSQKPIEENRRGEQTIKENISE